jgi:hypothetical protein
VSRRGEQARRAGEVSWRGELARRAYGARTQGEPDRGKLLLAAASSSSLLQLCGSLAPYVPWCVSKRSERVQIRRTSGVCKSGGRRSRIESVTSILRLRHRLLSSSRAASCPIDRTSVACGRLRWYCDGTVVTPQNFTPSGRSIPVGLATDLVVCTPCGWHALTC